MTLERTLRILLFEGVFPLITETAWQAPAPIRDNVIRVLDAKAYGDVRRTIVAPAASAPETSAATRAAPTARMVAYAEKLAKTKKLPLPAGYAQDFQACRRFLDQHG